jgi:hypothetical protein
MSGVLSLSIIPNPLRNIAELAENDLRPRLVYKGHHTYKRIVLPSTGGMFRNEALFVPSPSFFQIICTPTLIRETSTPAACIQSVRGLMT